MKTFTEIVGLSDIIRLPRIGKIKLGIRNKNQAGTEYPKEVDYFVVAHLPEVVKIYGENPKMLEIIIPVEDKGLFFPQSYKLHGSASSLVCIGDGKTAMRDDKKVEKTDILAENGEKENGRIEVVCKSPNKNIADPCRFGVAHGCRRCGNFRFMLPRVSAGGVYQIDTGSFNSTVHVNSSIYLIRQQMKTIIGKEMIAGIPLLLRRVPTDTRHDGKKQVHYCLQIVLPYSYAELKEKAAEMRSLQTPPIQLDVPPNEEEVEEDLIPASRQIEGGSFTAPTDDPGAAGEAEVQTEQPEEDPETAAKIKEVIEILGWASAKVKFHRDTFPSAEKFLEFLSREVDRRIADKEQKKGNGNGAPVQGSGPQRSYSKEDIETMRKGISLMLMNLCNEDKEEAHSKFIRITESFGLKVESTKALKAPEVIGIWQMVKDLHDKGMTPAVVSSEPNDPQRPANGTNGKSETKKPAAAQEELPWRG